MPPPISERYENPHLKQVGRITGHFIVPAYQRGYRWGEHEVKALLDDVYLDGKRDNNMNYCLQPVVVKRLNRQLEVDCFELIDGQQRLTTVYLIYYYLRQKLGEDISLPFHLTYMTRPGSTEYLRNPTLDKKDDNIDFFHMYVALQCINEWFQAAAKRAGMAPVFVWTKVYGHLQKEVHVIWYDAGAADPTTLFIRLNVGRIPLTNGELVKALLLARSGDQKLADKSQQIEIATQWDMIERELQKDEFWAFLTNEPGTIYPTRIEFLFDLVAKKPMGEKDRFYTFLHFKKLMESPVGGNAQSVWKLIRERYYLLREWFEDHELYHKIGYLVAIGVGLSELMDASEERCTRSGLKVFLDASIRKTLDLDESGVRELSYDNHYEKCDRLLLLFNVESVSLLKHSSERYPFHSHKEEKWSLEHIHAQNAEPLTTQDQWKSWLRDSNRALAALHLPDSAEDMERQALVDEIEIAVKDEVTRPIFNAFAPHVMKFLHPAGAVDAVHSIANLALLSSRVNSSLKNAAFQAKRLRIIEMDRKGMFIPICTRRAFLKYYTDAGSQQMHLWGLEDQNSYLNKMLSPEEGIGTYLKPATEVRS